MTDDLTSLTVRIEGIVQGVGFRDFLVMAAQRNQLDGWVRNCDDGAVEALVSGTTKAVEAFVGAATQGPRGAKGDGGGSDQQRASRRKRLQGQGVGKMSMEKRKLGLSGLSVHPFCFGGNVFGWTADEKTSFQLLDAFVAAGFEFIDTADVYSSWVPGHEGGESEKVIGKWLQARGGRTKVVIATKGRHAGRPSWPVGREHHRGLRRFPEAASDRYIDLYQSHIEPKKTPQTKPWKPMEVDRGGKGARHRRLQFQGDHAGGVAENFRKRGAFPVTPRCSRFTIWWSAISKRRCNRSASKKRLASFPIIRWRAGFLTGKYRSKADLEGSSRGDTVKPYLTRENLALLSRMDELAKARNVSLSAIAFAWLRDRPSVVAPIASATSLQQLDSLIKGASLTLTADEVAALG